MKAPFSANSAEHVGDQLLHHADDAAARNGFRPAIGDEIAEGDQ